MAHDSKKKSERRNAESRREFLKQAALAGGLAALPATVAHALQGRANVEKEGARVQRAVRLVEANARKGIKEVSLVEAYKKGGGVNQDVLEVLIRVDDKLKQANAFEKFDKIKIDKAVADGIIDFVGPRTGAVAGKNDLYQVRQSAARLMFDKGGPDLKAFLTSKNVKIRGYN